MPTTSNHSLRHRLTSLVLLIGFTFLLPGAATVLAQEATPPFDTEKLFSVDRLITQAIDDGELPGAVVVGGYGDEIVYQKAFGSRVVSQGQVLEEMTVDTIFDLASLTKVVATTTSIMMLVEMGEIRLRDRVATFIPEFARYGKENVTIHHLLTHMSGLRPDLDLNRSWRGSDVAIQLATEEILLASPGTKFIYSDINFFLLGEIVRRVSEMPLDEFAQTKVFEPTSQQTGDLKCVSTGKNTN